MGRGEQLNTQTSTRLSNGRVVGQDSNSRSSLNRQTSQSSSVSNKKELGPVKEGNIK